MKNNKEIKKRFSANEKKWETKMTNDKEIKKIVFCANSIINLIAHYSEIIIQLRFSISSKLVDISPWMPDCSSTRTTAVLRVRRRKLYSLEMFLL